MAIGASVSLGSKKVHEDVGVRMIDWHVKHQGQGFISFCERFSGREYTLFSRYVRLYASADDLVGVIYSHRWVYVWTGSYEMGIFVKSNAPRCLSTRIIVSYSGMLVLCLCWLTAPGRKVDYIKKKQHGIYLMKTHDKPSKTTKRLAKTWYNLSVKLGKCQHKKDLC